MLKKHAITLYSEVISYVKLVLKDMPEDKMIEKIGEGEKPADILFHLVAMPHWWLKQSGKAFEFSAKFENLNDVNILLDKQLSAFKTKLENEEELKWTNSDEFDSKNKSVPWIMIRSAYHMMHHASMLIYVRHIFGLPSLENPNWSKIVDLCGDLNFS